MGFAKRMKCPKCRYTFCHHEGVGYAFWMVYEDTVEKAKKGKLGKELKAFFDEHPDGIIRTDSVTLCCDECGFLESNLDLTMYIQMVRNQR